MLAPATHENWKDANGNPAGGVSTGTGFTISWQNGPLGRHAPDCRLDPSPGGADACVAGCTRRDPNGAFVENVVAAAAQRIEFYETSRFSCEENRQALLHLRKALEWMNRRTAGREERKVEGTHSV